MNRSDKAIPLGPVRLPSRETAALVESVKDYAILMLDPAGRVPVPAVLKTSSRFEFLWNRFPVFPIRSTCINSLPEEILLV